MSLIIDAVYENGVLRPLTRLDLAEHQQVRVILDMVTPEDATRRPVGTENPMDGIRIATGIADLAEHFDDYRFG